MLGSVTIFAADSVRPPNILGIQAKVTELVKWLAVIWIVIPYTQNIIPYRHNFEKQYVTKAKQHMETGPGQYHFPNIDCPRLAQRFETVALRVTASVRYHHFRIYSR
jgi:hypothetical protein